MKTNTCSGSFFQIGFALIALVALSLSGCSIIPKPAADPTRNYVLATPPATAPAIAVHDSSAKKIVIGLRPIGMPDYLTGRKTIAVRHGNNEIVFNEFARWAEPLQSGIARIVRERLVSSGVASSVEMLPGRAVRDYDLIVRITACEGSATSPTEVTTSFSAEYEFTSPNGTLLTGIRYFTAPPQTWDSKTFASLADSLSIAAAALADDIAQNLPAK